MSLGLAQFQICVSGSSLDKCQVKRRPLTLCPLEVVRLLSAYSSAICAPSLESIEPQQVLGNDHQSGLSARTAWATAVEASQLTIAFDIGEGDFDRLTAQSIPRLNFRIGHLLSLRVEEFLAFQTLDVPAC